MPQTIIRQGDVGLIPLATQPVVRGLKASNKRLIRKGEHGGRHELETLETATIWEEPLAEGLFRRFVQVREPTRIVHNEHAAVTLQPGWYEIRIQREWVEQATRYAAD